MGNACVFSSICHIRKMKRNLSNGENLGNQFPYSFHSMSDFYSWIHFIIGKYMGFPFDFSQHQKTQRKNMVWKRDWDIGSHTFPIIWVISFSIRFPSYAKRHLLVPILSPKHGCFSSIRFQSYVILYHMGNTQFSPSVSDSTGKCSKIHLVSTQVVFLQYCFFYLLENLVISSKNKQKSPDKVNSIKKIKKFQAC